MVLSMEPPLSARRDGINYLDTFGRERAIQPDEAKAKERLHCVSERRPTSQWFALARKLQQYL